MSDPPCAPCDLLHPHCREAYVPINPHYLALASSIAVGAQVLLKVGASGTETATAQFLRVPTIAGLVVYMVSAVLYVVALRKMTISVAFDRSLRRQGGLGRSPNRRPPSDHRRSDLAQRLCLASP